MPAVLTPQRLAQQDKVADRALSFARKQRVEVIGEYLGRHALKDDDKKRALNLINRGMQIVIPHIVHRNPQHDTTTENMLLRGAAIALGRKLDINADRIKRKTVSRRWAFEALIGTIAPVRVGLKQSAEAFNVDDDQIPLGTPYVKNVSLDSWCADTQATSLEGIAWEREQYRVPRAYVLDSGLFSGKALDKIARLPKVTDSKRSRDSDTDPAEDIGRSDESSRRFDLVELIELRDYAIYAGSTTYIATLPADSEACDEWLMLREWEGDTRGPFVHLQPYPVPDQVQGFPWIAQAREQADLFNRVIDSYITQVAKSKKVGIRERGTADDDEVQAVADAEHGDWIDVTNKDSFDVLDFSFNSPAYRDLADMVLNFWNIGQSQINMAGGSTPDTNSDTATEFQGLMSNMNVVIEDLRTAHREAEEEVSRRLAHFIIEDPLEHELIPLRLPGGEMITVQWTAMMDRGTLSDYTIKIRVGSMPYRDPAVRAHQTMQAVKEIRESAVAEFQTQGLISSLGVAKVLRDEMDLERLDECVRDPAFIEEDMAQMQTAGAGAMRQGGGPFEPEQPGQQQARRPIDETRSALNTPKPTGGNP